MHHILYFFIYCTFIWFQIFILTFYSHVNFNTKGVCENISCKLFDITIKKKTLWCTIFIFAYMNSSCSVYLSSILVFAVLFSHLFLRNLNFLKSSMKELKRRGTESLKNSRGRKQRQRRYKVNIMGSGRRKRILKKTQGKW